MATREVRKVELQTLKTELEKTIRVFRRKEEEPQKDVAECSCFEENERERLRCLAIASRELCNVQIALNLLETGWDGKCLGCGKTIAEARLKAIIFVTKCTTCEDTQKIGHDQKREHRCRSAYYGRVYE